MKGLAIDYAILLPALLPLAGLVLVLVADLVSPHLRRLPYAVAGLAALGSAAATVPGLALGGGSTRETFCLTGRAAGSLPAGGGLPQVCLWQADALGSTLQLAAAALGGCLHRPRVAAHPPQPSDRQHPRAGRGRAAARGPVRHGRRGGQPRRRHLARRPRARDPARHRARRPLRPTVRRRGGDAAARDLARLLRPARARCRPVVRRDGEPVPDAGRGAVVRWRVLDGVGRGLDHGVGSGRRPAVRLGWGRRARNGARRRGCRLQALARAVPRVDAHGIRRFVGARGDVPRDGVQGGRARGPARRAAGRGRPRHARRAVDRRAVRRSA